MANSTTAVEASCCNQRARHEVYCAPARRLIGTGTALTPTALAPGGATLGGYNIHFLEPRITAFHALVEFGSCESPRHHAHPKALAMGLRTELTLWKVDPDFSGPMIIQR